MFEDLAKAAEKPQEQRLEDSLDRPTSDRGLVREISGEVRKNFTSASMTEEELSELLEREDHQARGVPYDE